jgi:hypothetical protein
MFGSEAPLPCARLVRAKFSEQFAWKVNNLNRVAGQK